MRMRALPTATPVRAVSFFFAARLGSSSGPVWRPVALSGKTIMTKKEIWDHTTPIHRRAFLQRMTALGEAAVMPAFSP